MHLIINGIDRVYTPQGNQWEKTWHNLQTPIAGGIALDGSNIPDVFSPIVECGIKADFDADIANVPAELQEYMGANPLSEWKMILADCRGGLAKSVLPLHVPKKGYKIHQNKQLFDAMVGAANQVLGADGFEIVTVGTLGGFSQFFVSIAIKGQADFTVGNLANGAKDVWNKFFNLNSSHNGLIGSNRLVSMIRAVCFNTVQASIMDAEQGGTISAIKHTENSETLITAAQFAKDLELWVKQSEAFKETLLATKRQGMTVDKFKAFAAGVFTNPKSDELSTHSFNRVEAMVPLFNGGMGNNGKTRYDAINAFTEFFTSGAGTGSDTVKANKRVAMANFGRGNDWKLEAIAIATTPELYAETVKRGEMLYADKLTVQTTAN